MSMNGIDFAEVVNLTADPEPRVSQNGGSRATFRAAYNPRERDRQSGDYKDGETTWISCTAFGELGDHVAQSLSKGDRVLVKGRLTTQRYQDNQGQEREGLNLIVDAIGPDLRFSTVMVTRKGGGGGAQRPQGGAGQAGWATPSPGGFGGATSDPGGFGNFGPEDGNPF